MSPLKRSDVKNHLHSPFFTKIHLIQPESQPDATGFSGAEPDTIKAIPSGFAQDFLAEHSSSRGTAAPADRVTGSGSLRRLPVRKACKREAALRFPAHRLHPARTPGSPHGTSWRELDACRRDHGAGSRHHDSPDGLALHVGRPRLLPNGHWDDGGKCGPACAGACSGGSGKAIQRRRTRFCPDEKSPGFAHRGRYSPTPPYPATLVAGNYRREASVSDPRKISHVSRRTRAECWAMCHASAPISCRDLKRGANHD